MFGGGGGGVQETADTKQEQINNIKLYNYAQSTYKPFIDKHIARTTANANSDAQSKAVAGQVNAEVMKGVSATTPTNAVSTTKQLTTAAEIEAAGATEAKGKVRSRQLGERQNIVDIGRGQQTEAQAGKEAIASQSLNSAIQDKVSDLQTQGAYENAAGAAVGAGAAIYGRYLKRPNVTDGKTGITSGPNAGEDLYAGDLR